MRISLVAPSTTAATHATSSTGDDANGKEEEQHWRDDDRERFGICNDQQPRGDQRDRRAPPQNSPPRQGEEPLGIDGIRAFTPQLRQAN